MKNSNTNIVQFPSSPCVMDNGLSNDAEKKTVGFAKKYTSKISESTDSAMFYSPWNKTKRLFG